MNKNDEIIIKIEDLTDTGEGIGHAEGLAVFVKDAVPGDTVKAGITKVKKTYCFARTIEITEASADRTEPVCPIARPCGGCQLQQLNYEAQLRFKTGKVQSCFKRIAGIDVTVSDTLGMTDGSPAPWLSYRNKASFPVRSDKDGKAAIGFFAGRTHSVIPTTSCAIEFAGHERILKTILDFMEEKHISAYEEADAGRGESRDAGRRKPPKKEKKTAGNSNGIIRHVMMRKGFSTGEIMVVVVIASDELKDASELAKRLTGLFSKGSEGASGKVTSVLLNINKENTNVIFGDRFINLYGPGYITDTIGDVKFKISAPAFFQVNPLQTEVLYGKALEAAGLTGNETVWDLYCGTGTISLFLAKNAGRVYGVEIVPEAVENAKENASANGINNAEFFVGAAEDVVGDCYEKDREKYKADVVVLDPPRKGADAKLIETVLNMEPERIVYVSCDPATLARDVKMFCEGKYEVESVQPVDMFPMTTGVETVALLKRKG